MSSHTRDRLKKAWGLCDRHAWGHILMDASFRRGWMHGPAILYLDLMEQTWAAFNYRKPLYHPRSAIRNKGPCLMCEEGFGPDTIGKAKEDVIQRGRDLSELQKFARDTKPYWERTVCGRCAGNESAQRCRAHLIEDLSSGAKVDLSRHFELIEDLLHHIRLYADSFRMELQGTETKEDKAALISAVGWCSGWKPFFSMISPFDKE